MSIRLTRPFLRHRSPRNEQNNNTILNTLFIAFSTFSEVSTKGLMTINHIKISQPHHHPINAKNPPKPDDDDDNEPFRAAAAAAAAPSASRKIKCCRSSAANKN